MNLLRFKEFSKVYLYFILLVVTFFCLSTSVELLNNKFWTNDFRVYYDATKDFFSGNNPYIKNYGLDTGFFKYPPFTLYLFKFFTFFEYRVAQFIHLSFLGCLLIYSIIALKNLSENILQCKFKNSNNWLLFASFFIIILHLSREIHMGNINLYLLGFFVVGLKSIHSEKPWVTAIFWSLMLILKPIMILSVIPLLFYRKWKIILIMSGFGLVFFLLPICNLGWSGNWILWGNWVKSVSNHGNYLISENSITYLSSYYFGLISEWIPSLLCLSVLLAVMIFRGVKMSKSTNQLIIWSVILTAFTPNFFITDTEHFLLAIPLIIFLLSLLSNQKSISSWALFGVGILFFSLNSNDLLGKKLSDFVDTHGLLGIGNILFVLLFLQVLVKRNRQITLST